MKQKKAAAARLFTLVLFACASFTAIGETVAPESITIDEDSLFGDAAEDMLVEEVKPTENKIESILLTTDGVELGGRYSFSASSLWAWNDPASFFENLAEPDSGFANVNLGASLFFDARPSEDTRVFGKMSTSYPFKDVVHVDELFSNPSGCLFKCAYGMIDRLTDNDSHDCYKYKAGEWNVEKVFALAKPWICKDGGSAFSRSKIYGHRLLDYPAVIVQDETVRFPCIDQSRVFIKDLNSHNSRNGFEFTFKIIPAERLVPCSKDIPPFLERCVQSFELPQRIEVLSESEGNREYYHWNDN